ncbi:MAG: hypothetical protein JNK88_01080 [Mangrovicoccus sp.]|nr:hypothetical protein [Mangrovicoccus sp.]
MPQVEANWLAKILDEIEGYACENGLESLLAEVRTARRITSLELGEAGPDLTSPGGSAPAAARSDAGLSPPVDG